MSVASRNWGERKDEFGRARQRGADLMTMMLLLLSSLLVLLVAGRVGIAWLPDDVLVAGERRSVCEREADGS